MAKTYPSKEFKEILNKYEKELSELKTRFDNGEFEYESFEEVLHSCKSGSLNEEETFNSICEQVNDVIDDFIDENYEHYEDAANDDYIAECEIEYFEAATRFCNEKGWRII